MIILLFALTLLILCVTLFFVFRSFKVPRLDRVWEKHHAVLPTMTVQSDGTILVTDVRQTRYRAEFDFDLAYKNEVYDPKKITRIWYTICPWGPLSFQAHTWLTFDFADGRSLVAGAEVRKTNAFTFYVTDVLAGDFEIFYCLSDERDMLFLRTHIWKNETRMYPLKLTLEQRTSAFLLLSERVNHYAHHAEWYRVLKRQCNTEPVTILRAIGASLPIWHPFYVVAGWFDRILFKKSLIDTHSKTFAEVQALHTFEIEKVSIIQNDEHFSEHVRLYMQQRGVMI